MVDAWIGAIDDGWIDGLLVEEGGAIIGSAALVRDPQGWSAHVGEVRLLVSPDRRGSGLGRDLLEGLLAVASAHGLAKLTAAMLPDQLGSVTLFERLGFRREAMLERHVRDGSGTPHDLAVLALHLWSSRSAG